MRFSVWVSLLLSLGQINPSPAHAMKSLELGEIHCEGELARVIPEKRSATIVSLREKALALEFQARELEYQARYWAGRAGQNRHVHRQRDDAYYASILAKHGIRLSFEDICARWREPHRHFHFADTHLNEILNGIELEAERLSLEDQEVLILAALFHDIVYDPRRSDNEEKSIRVFNSVTAQRTQVHERVEKIIRDTKSHQTSERVSEIFQDLDMAVLRGSFGELLEWEHSIFKEFQFLDWKVYQAKRLEFLEKYESYGPEIPALISYLRSFQPRIGVFVGSFDPFHLGHLDVLRQAEASFDKVIIARGRNPMKGQPESGELSQVLPFHQTASYDGFMTDFLKSLGYPVTLVRGLRDDHDLSAEQKQLQFLRDMMPEIQVVFVLTHERFSHISSSALRAIEKVQPGSSLRYLPGAQSAPEIEEK